MASNAVAARGTTIKIDGVAIGEVRSIKMPQSTNKTIDVTSHDSTGEEFVLGLSSGGEVTVSGLYYGGDAGQAALIAAFDARTVNAYTITPPAGSATVVTFNALVSALPMPESADHDGVLTFSCTLKVTGMPVRSIAASAGVTALEIVANAGAITNFTPTPHAVGTYAYIYHVLTTEEWVTFKATFAAGTCTVYNALDGTTTSLVSTVASGHLTLGAADTLTVFTVTQKDPDEAPKVYTITVLRPTA